MKTKKISRILIAIVAILIMAGVLTACTATYTVTFNSNEGTTFPAQKFDKDFELPVPTKEGYDFGGWYLDDGIWAQEFTGTSVPDKDITLYAKWTETLVYYSVAFRDWNGSWINVNGKASQEVLKGSDAVAPPNPAREGYRFTGWSAGFTNVTQDLTITAVYAINAYEVKFSSEGDIVDTKTVNFASEIDQLITLTKFGYELEGWYFDEEFEAKAETVPGRDCTVYAKWKYVGIEGLGITTNKTNNTLVYGQEIILTVRIQDEELELTYQWYCGNTLLEGETGETLTITPDVSQTEYSVKVTSEDNGYDETATVTLVIHKAILAVTVNDLIITYGDTPQYTATITGYQKDDTAASLDGEIVFETDYETDLRVGGYDITASGLVSENYTINYTDGTLTVNKKGLTIKANDCATDYGAAAPAYGFTGTGFVLGDDESDLDGTIAYAGQYTQGDNAGTYTITPSGLTSDNYAITYQTGNLTVNKIAITITADDITIAYRDAKPALTFKHTVLRNNDEIAVLGIITLNTEYTVGNGIGEKEITATGTDSVTNYTITYVSGKLTIEKATVQITVAYKAVTYGDDKPTFTSDFTWPDTLTYICDYEKGSDADVYDITIQTEYANFDATFTKGTLTVDKKGLTIKANDCATDYGAAAPAYGFTGTGFVLGDDESDLGGTISYAGQYTQGDNAGTYTITPSGLTSENYAITYQTGNLTVNKIAITITADDKTIAYRDAKPALTFKHTVLRNGDEIAVLGTITLNTEYTVGNGVGEKEITVTGAASVTNYTITYISGKLTIEKTNVHIEIDDKAITYGDDKPAFTSDFTWPDTLTYICDYQKGSDADDYDITIQTEYANFDATFTKGTLKVNKAAVTITVTAAKKYDENPYTNSNLPAAVAGLKNGETIKGTISTTRGDAAEYAYQGTDIGSSTDFNVSADFGIFAENVNKTHNYVINYNLSVEIGDVIEFNSNDVTVVYDGKTHNISVTVAEIVGNPLAYSIEYRLQGGEYSETFSKTNVGEYKVYFRITAADVGFKIQEGFQTLTITKAALTVTVNDAKVTYGQAANYTHKFDGFVNGETKTVLGGTLTYSCVYVYGETKTNVGKYDIAASGYTSGNYTITYVKGELEVEKAAYTGIGITHDPLTGTFSSVLTLADFELSEFYRWAVSTTRPEVGEHEYAAKYNADTTNYVDFDLLITIDLSKGVLVVTGNDVEVVYDGETHNITVTVEAGTGKTIVGEYKVEYKLAGGTYSETFGELDAGTYTVYYKMTADNYETQESYKTLTITPKNITVVINNVKVTYGQAPVYTHEEITGLIGNDTLAGELVYSCEYVYGEVKSNVGFYDITASGLSNGNYNISYTTGELEVEKADYSGITHAGIDGGAYEMKTLDDFVLDAHYWWVDSTVIPQVTGTSYAAKYNADSTNYNDFELNITITLTKGTLTIDSSLKEVDLPYGETVSAPITANLNGAAVSVSLTYSENNSFSVGGTYKISVSFEGDDNWNPVSAVDIIVKVRSVKIGDTMYTIEDAIYNSVSGNVIILVANTQFTADAALRAQFYDAAAYYTVKEDVTLLVPYSAANSTGMSDFVPNAGNSAYYYGITESDAYVTLTLNNINLAVFGTLNVNGNIGAFGRGGGTPGQMGNTVKYGMMFLDAQSTVTIKNAGKLNSTGFVIGDGTVVAESGAEVYDIFQIFDYPGGTAANNAKGDLLPFCQYSVQNIETKLIIFSGATYYANYFVYTSGTAVTGAMTIIGSGNRSMYQLSSGYIEKIYNYSTGVTTFNFYGNVAFNYISLQIRTSTASVTIDSNGKEAPIAGNFRINIKSGYNFTLKSSIKLMPGAKLYVENGATLVVNQGINLFVYAENQLYSAAAFQGFPCPYPSNFTSIRGYQLTAPSYDFSSEDSGHLVIDGCMIVNGNIAGPVETTLPDGNTNILIKGNTTITIKTLGSNEASASTRYNLTGTLSNCFFLDIALNSNSGSDMGKLYVVGTEPAADNITLDLDQYVPTKAGYTFAGWYTDLEYTSQRLEGIQTLPAKTTIYAKWTFELTFHYDGKDTTITQVYGKKYDIPDVEEAATGKIPDKWFTIQNGKPIEFTDTDVNTPYYDLYATFGEPESITITFDANGGYIDDLDYKEYIAEFDSGKIDSDIVDGMVPTNGSYEFEGWYYDEKCTIAFNKDFLIIGNLTLYAKWSTTYVNYINDSGTTVEVGYVDRGGIFALPNYTTDSNYITIWFANDDFTGYYAYDGMVNNYNSSFRLTFLSHKEVNIPKVTFNLDGGSGSCPTQTINYGATASKPTDPTKEGYVFKNWALLGQTTSYDFNTPVTSTITLIAIWAEDSSCIAEGSLITLADGSQKAVELLTGEDLLLVWNLFTGTFDVAPILFIDSDAADEYEIIHLYFSDGTEVKVIYEHAFWDFDLNSYVFLRNDAAQYLGHWFNKQITDAKGNMTWTKVQLTDVVIETEYTTSWSPVTFGHLCYYVNGMLSMPGATTGLINIFTVNGETMQYDQEAFLADIEMYGLFTYEEFADIFPIPEEIFEAFCGQYLKISIGKGLIDYEGLGQLIESYAKFFNMENDN